MTFEPDPLTVPDMAPLFLSQYSLYYTPLEASGIIDRAVELLGLDASSRNVTGFEREDAMVRELLMQDEGVVPGCFVHGAGETTTHTHTHTLSHSHYTHLHCIHTHVHHLLDQ